MGANSKAYAKAWRARNRERLAAYARERYQRQKATRGERPLPRKTRKGTERLGRVPCGSVSSVVAPSATDQLALAKQCVISAVVGFRDSLAQYVTALVERLVAERAEVVAYQAVATALGQAELRLAANSNGNGNGLRGADRPPAPPVSDPAPRRREIARVGVRGRARAPGAVAAAVAVPAPAAPSPIPDEPIDSGEDITSRAIARCKREAAAKPHLVDAMRHEVNVLRGKKRARQLQEARE